MKKSYLIFVVLSFMIVLLAMFMGGTSLDVFLDINSFLMVSLIPTFLLMTNYSPSEIVLAFRIGFKKEGIVKKELQKSINFFDSLGKYLILSGILGAITGFISMLASFAKGTEEYGYTSTYWGGGFALTIITILYSLILYMIVAVPFKNGLRNRLIEME
ncbi:MAG: MotA/TolQ/ExbB proton channel family protein [Spirochaetales bacterium]|nr:MotA/TolQ/ExbB proton channel family protein [Spirochaetales bacterium]